MQWGYEEAETAVKKASDLECIFGEICVCGLVNLKIVRLGQRFVWFIKLIKLKLKKIFWSLSIQVTWGFFSEWIEWIAIVFMESERPLNCQGSVFILDYCVSDGSEYLDHCYRWKMDYKIFLKQWSQVVKYEIRRDATVGLHILFQVIMFLCSDCRFCT